MRHVLVDTGPLVAILSRADEHHDRCVDVLKSISGPLLSCWPVITEAAWLLRGDKRSVQQLLRSISEGFVVLLPLADSDASAIAEVMGKYADMEPQLADATLVHLAQRDGIETIFTLDRRDFSVYRGSRKRAFRILPEVD
jgi:hypothetical protein